MGEQTPVEVIQRELKRSGLADDGFGSEAVMCDREDCDLQVVRPGKFQCHGGCVMDELRAAKREGGEER